VDLRGPRDLRGSLDMRGMGSIQDLGRQRGPRETLESRSGHQKLLGAARGCRACERPQGAVRQARGPPGARRHHEGPGLRGVMGGQNGLQVDVGKLIIFTTSIALLVKDILPGNYFYATTHISELMDIDSLHPIMCLLCFNPPLPIIMTLYQQ
jgi:hypothetical protein